MSEESSTTDRPQKGDAPTTGGIPRHPLSAKLLAIIGRLMVEVDAYRTDLGYPTIGPSRRWNVGELKQGEQLGPWAMVLDDGTVVVRLES